MKVSHCFGFYESNMQTSRICLQNENAIRIWKILLGKGKVLHQQAQEIH